MIFGFGPSLSNVFSSQLVPLFSLSYMLSPTTNVAHQRSVGRRMLVARYVLVVVSVARRYCPTAFEGVVTRETVGIIPQFFDKRQTHLHCMTQSARTIPGQVSW